MDDSEREPAHSLDNNFDDFEKLEHAAHDEPEDHIEPVTSTNDEAEEDLYTGSEPLPDPLASEAEANTADLLGFDSPAKKPSAPPEPEPAAPEPAPPTSSQIDSFFQPDSSLTKEAAAPLESAKSGGSSCEGTCCPWMKNIDPRGTMADNPETELTETPAVEADSSSGSEGGKSKVIDLVYWRNVKKSGIVFGGMMVTLLSLAFFSVLSVLAYLSLAVLTVTLSFRIYKNVLQAVQKSGDGHPFKTYLEMDVCLPNEKVHHIVDIMLSHVNTMIKEVRRFFLVEDLVDSVKFGLLLWVFTYIGAWFNGLTLIILSVVTVFTVPKFYETNKTQIDNYLDIASTHVKKIVAQVQSKIPLPGKKQKAQ
ncbi:reticulon-1-A-like isoform X1 [Lineus longissimus]|uniref:reticulon-1-A-like isoform X1 n=1 Tax=Lineus longissimus TaxID=88925 RepID=UPI00315DA876